MNVSDFTHQAAALVARNDRRASRRQLLRFVRARLSVAGFAWSAMVLAAFVLWLLPMNMRMA